MNLPDIKDMKILEPFGVTKGIQEGGAQFYSFIGKDETGKQHIMTFGMKSCYTESFEKQLSRLFPIKIEQPKETTNEPATN